MDAVNLAKLLVSKGKVDLLLRPGNDIQKMLTINFTPSSGQLYFTCWDPTISLDFALPNPRVTLDATLIEKILNKILTRFYVIDVPAMKGGLGKLSEEAEHVGKKLTAAQIKKLSACLPIAIKGVKIKKPICIEKPKISDIKNMLKLGVSANYEFQPEFYDKEKNKVLKKPKRSVLQYALEQKKYNIADLLIENGANVNYSFEVKKGSKQSLLSRMISLGNDKGIELLRKHGAKYSAADVKEMMNCLVVTIKGGKMPLNCTKKMTVKEIKELFELGADYNYEFQPEYYDQNKKKIMKKAKRSILQYALEHNRIPIAKLLINQGAEVNYVFTDKKKTKITLLHRIASMRNKNAIELLIKNGADVNSQEAPNKMTPLHMILSPFHNKTATDMKKTIEIVKLFLSEKPNLFLENQIEIKKKGQDPISIRSNIIQSTHFLEKKLDGKLQSKQLSKIIDDYVSKLSLAERLVNASK